MVDKTKKTAKGNGQPVIDDMEMPSDFQMVTPDAGKPKWVKPSQGTIIHGRLMGVFSRGGKREGQYYQVKIMRPVKVVSGAGDEAEEFIAKRGDIVNVDERQQIEGFEPLALSDGVFDVFIKFVEKIPLPSGNTFWRIQAGSKQLRAPSAPIQRSTVADADIPF